MGNEKNSYDFNIDNVDGVNFNDFSLLKSMIGEGITHKKSYEMSMKDKVNILYRYLVLGDDVITLARDCDTYEHVVEGVLNFYCLDSKIKDIRTNKGACSKCVENTKEPNIGFHNVLQHFIERCDNGHSCDFKTFLKNNYGQEI